MVIGFPDLLEKAIEELIKGQRKHCLNKKLDVAGRQRQNNKQEKGESLVISTEEF